MAKKYTKANKNRQIHLDEEHLRNFISYSVARLLKESNLGITTHFDGKGDYERENPYKDGDGHLTWEEFLEKKKQEKDSEKSFSTGEGDKKRNLGTTAHFFTKRKDEGDDDNDIAGLNEDVFMGRPDPARIAKSIKATGEQICQLADRISEQTPNTADASRKWSMTREMATRLSNCLGELEHIWREKKSDDDITRLNDRLAKPKQRKGWSDYEW